IDLNDAGPQRDFDVIPTGTIVNLQMIIRPGGAGDEGWRKKAADGRSEHLDCVFVVVDEGKYHNRKIFQPLTLEGTTPNHQEAAGISRKFLAAVIESARGIRPDDKSEAAKQARHL